MTFADFDVGPELPMLTAKRLRLRWLTAADIPALFAIFNNAEVTRYWSHPAMTSVAEAETLLAKIRAGFQIRRLFQWGMELAQTEEVIGTCTLAGLDATHQRAELGYALKRSCWGHGYMSEALPVLLHFAFEQLALRRITADVDPRNGASIRQLERLGFQREGYLREHYWFNNEIQDAVLFGLLRSEFTVST